VTTLESMIAHDCSVEKIVAQPPQDLFDEL
jgi:hypothetical protein